jgi:hypothetical protein
MLSFVDVVKKNLQSEREFHLGQSKAAKDYKSGAFPLSRAGEWALVAL